MVKFIADRLQSAVSTIAAVSLATRHPPSLTPTRPLGPRVKIPTHRPSQGSHLPDSRGTDTGTTAAMIILIRAPRPMLMTRMIMPARAAAHGHQFGRHRS